MDSPVPDAEQETELVDQPFATSEMGESMDADLLPELRNLGGFGAPGRVYSGSASGGDKCEPYCSISPGCDVGDGAAVDSVGIYSDMGGVCRTFSGFSPYRLMFGEECTLPMDIGLSRRQQDPSEDITSLYAVWVKDSLEVAFDQVRRNSGQAVQ